MSTTTDRDGALERLAERLLHEQPLLRAPPSLRADVMAELERRAAAPWWRRNFTHWPMAARVAFVVASFGIVKLTLQGVLWASAELRSSFIASAVASPASRLDVFHGTVSSLRAAGGYLFTLIPSHWLYVGLLLGAAIYVALFGLGAAAYRTLYK